MYNVCHTEWRQISWKGECPSHDLCSKKPLNRAFSSWKLGKDSAWTMQH